MSTDFVLRSRSGHERRAAVPRLHFAVIVALVAALVVSAMPSGRALQDAEPVGKYSFSKVERCFLNRINAMRKRQNRKALNWDKQLGYVARRHARSMASKGAIFHHRNLGGTVTRWNRLGQNVGRGPACKSLFRAFNHSSVHRGNMLGRWRHMGVGVEKRGGNVFVMHIFESRRDPGNKYQYP